MKTKAFVLSMTLTVALVMSTNWTSTAGPRLANRIAMRWNETATPAAFTWQIERVDAQKNFSHMGQRSLALDGVGHPHIVYGQDHLYYAWHDGTTWHLETVDTAWGVGEYTSLALDAEGHPHISYYDSINGDLKYARFDGTSWHIQTVDSEGAVGLYTSLALDAAGYPHISYYDTINEDLKYARGEITTPTPTPTSTPTPTPTATPSPTPGPMDKFIYLLAAYFERSLKILCRLTRGSSRPKT